MTDDTSKRFSIESTVRHHLTSAKTALLGTPYWVWPLPLLLGAGILLMRQSPIGWFTEKPVQEIAAPVVIGLAAVLALFVHRWVRAFFTLLLACFAGVLFLRELHFSGTGTGAYAAIILLAWWASSRRDEIRDFLKWPSIRGLLGGSLWTYLITKMFDRHYFSFLPDYLSWHDNVEESLETLAHVMVLALVVMTLRLGSLQGEHGARDAPATPDSDAA